MNQNQKKLQLNRALSIALSLLVVVAVCVTVIAVVAARRAKPNDKTENTTDGSTASSSTTITTSTTESTKDNTPVVAEKITFIAPVTTGTVIKEWSADVPVFSGTMEDYRLHMGVDIAADAGTPVYAVADGTVETVEFDPMMGQTVVITHTGGYRSVYKNLQTAIPEGITQGAKICAGDEIGAVGDTALIEIAEAPHLHFELYKDNASDDPLSHFTVTPIDASTDYEDQ